MEFILRAWKKEDAESVAVAANNEKIARNLRNVFPYPYALADAEWYVNDCIAHGEEHQITRAIVVDGKAVGSIGIFVKDDVYEKSGELGYWLAEECWGKGIMTEAVKKICREAYDKFDIVRIFAEPFAHNMGSRRVLEKAGFTCEGIMRDGVFKGGMVYSYCMYSLLKDEVC
ncbi:MAG: GNAT family N-acetyltransferase [Wujia sp.]